MLDPSVIVRREKLYMMQRYDPKRIPLLMVHGLMSTPISFANLTNDLFADPVIHARYQIWHYYYPTGAPLLQNAAVLRRILKHTLSEIDPAGRDFATNHLVVLGHSMGGLMAHTLISDSGYKLWDSVITARPEAFRCDVKTGSVLNAVFLFERENRIRRAILISVPHRGSPIAVNWIGSLGQSLYRADRELQKAFWTLVEEHLDQINSFFSRPLKEGRLSAIHTLSANSPVLMALAEIPPANSLSQHHQPNKRRPAANGTRRRCCLLQQPSRRSGIRRRPFASVMKLSSTRTPSPRSSGYFAAISRRCELRSLKGAASGKRFRESIYRGLFAQSGAEGADSIIQAWATPEELGCPEHRALKERRWRLARRAVCFAAG